MARPRWLRNHLISASAGVVLALAVVGPASAQPVNSGALDRAVRTAETGTASDIDETAAYRLKVDKDLGWTERHLFELGGFVNFTGVWLVDRDDNSRRLIQPELTLFGRAVFDGAHTIFVRSRFQYRDFSEGDSFDGRGDRWRTPFMDRYWYEFNLARQVEANEGRTIDGNFTFRGGRQFLDWGAGLSLSQVLYAALFTADFGNGWQLIGLAGVTPPDDAITDFDQSRKNYNRDTKRGFFGGRLEYSTPGGHTFYGYGLYMPDFNDADSPRIPIGDVEFDYDGVYLGIGAEGAFNNQLMYNLEFVYQLGQSHSDPLRSAQTEEDISAWALAGELRWLLRDSHQTVIRLSGASSSGDDDRLVATDTIGGNLSGSDDKGFNSMGFYQTGLAFAPALSNLSLIRLGATSFPFIADEGFHQVQVGLDGTLLFKTDSDAPIDEIPTNDDAFLGGEIDLSVNWRLTSDLTMNARYGIFLPADAIANGAHARHFIFFGATLSF